LAGVVALVEISYRENNAATVGRQRLRDFESNPAVGPRDHSGPTGLVRHVIKMPPTHDRASF
jgi:hypothetical protein